MDTKYKNILVYAIPDSNAGLAIEQMLKKNPFEVKVVRYYTHKRFIQFCIDHRSEPNIVVTVIERLKDFIAIHSLLNNNHLSNLIVVCDDKDETISLAREKSSMYLTNSGELTNVASVVNKMLVAAQKNI